MFGGSLYTTNFCVEVVLPLPVKGSFTYLLPDEFQNVTIGARAIVPFGNRKFYSGIIINIIETEKVKTKFELKEVIAVLDSQAIILEKQIELWKWMSSYYFATLGEVMNNALPAMFKITSETFISLHPEFAGEISTLSEAEIDLTNALMSSDKLSIKQAAELLNIKPENIYKHIRQLISNCIIELQEEVKNPYRPMFRDNIQIAEGYRSDDKMNEVFKSLEKRSFKQLKILLSYFKHAANHDNEYPEISKKLILDDAGATHTTLNSLIEKGIIDIIKHKVSRLELAEASSTSEDIFLTDKQEEALSNIKSSFENHDVTLLHGVTSSGKTEIYFKLIAETLAQGKQVLFLLPEIALTTQIVERTVKYFGEQVGVYHSKYNHNERVEIWNAILENNKDLSKGYNIIIGARSSIFLPFDNLGLIIIDEEHDYSYKQTDMSPRYNGRDSAIFLANLFNAKVLLGSATPSIESYNNAQNDKYGLVEITERYGGLLLPETTVIDMKRKSDKNNISHFSTELIEKMKSVLENKKQILIYHNRRGFSLRLECEVCGWVPECIHCDVSLIYHKTFNQLRCHYCGYNKHVPSTCPNCHSEKIFMKGFGTELIEEELELLFPQAVIKRMDLDTTKRKHAFSKLIAEFSSGKIDILVGTQMITKGLDFDNVALVGIVNADNMLYFPDFRSFERSFQQICQVSGRAGRKNERGEVYIQTYSPDHKAIKYAIDNNYKGMYESQLIERKTFLYPPFVRLIDIKLKHKDPKVLDKAAEIFGDMLKRSLGKRVLGPEYHFIPRLNNQYIKSILIKIERTQDFMKLKNEFRRVYEIFSENPQFKSVRIVVDVDPY
ncbi:primosomal protein N' [Bacteroidales bacterium OttesenSCG-928-K03]|nr:primosomal protein N' [Bacteroidales bacterium OttesenSCG-928-L14]MDL2240755.1 primosomal protein N' [Bacteroidales bacterium OttesenSCG-928-K22]MDL2242236.1 primosomal protein N' [Bacteroidales bacterium OttesenSCG-928-K03]